jgi:hypothetical protein
MRPDGGGALLRRRAGAAIRLARLDLRGLRPMDRPFSGDLN